ncbi:hypothetical protein BS78_01G080700 [Paspalum vaginatum]|nr:hypothetical protein BS78_01G080700 [Paspalum vaginatum]
MVPVRFSLPKGEGHRALPPTPIRSIDHSSGDSAGRPLLLHQAPACKHTYKRTGIRRPPFSCRCRCRRAGRKATAESRHAALRLDMSACVSKKKCCRADVEDELIRC